MHGKPYNLVPGLRLILTSLDKHSNELSEERANGAPPNSVGSIPNKR